MSFEDEVYAVYGCAIDFARALYERNRFWKWLFKFAVGRYAYREYELLVWNMEMGGLGDDIGYGLEDASYHKKSMKAIRKDGGWSDVSN